MQEFGVLELPASIGPQPDNSDLIAGAADLLRSHIAITPTPRIAPVSFEALFGGQDPPPTSALGRIAQTFELSQFESGVLLTLAAIAIDPALAANCAVIQGQSRSGAISFAFAAQLLPDARLGAIRPDAPLRLWRLIEPDVGAEALSATLFRIDERILFFLTGANIASESMKEIAPGGWMPRSQRDLADQMTGLIDLDHDDGGAAVQLCGDDPGALRQISAAACNQLGVKLLAMSAAALPTVRSDLVQLARQCSRDLVLANGVLLLEAGECSPDVANSAAQFIALVTSPALVAAPVPVRTEARAAVRFDVPPLTIAERREHWRLLAPDMPGPALDQIARTFLLDSAGRSAASLLAGGPAADQDRLWQACRIASRDRLEGLGDRVESQVNWDDLVLPEGQADLLRDIVDHVALAGMVFEDWRFDSKLSRGTGIAALFAGPSGTGKTLAAEVLANVLGRDLFRIDLSQVISKYIGETEKNLGKIFAAAEGGGAILLFDEADALFGKRSEVQDSHDRYANIEVSYLLQRMETYAGLSILTTNLRDALDKAFLRRLRFIVQFAYPNATQRQRIWERALPDGLPTAGLDFARLAQYDLTGGAIRNVALAGAFLAARDGGPLTMSHLATAAAREYHKLEKPLGSRDPGRAR